MRFKIKKQYIFFFLLLFFGILLYCSPLSAYAGFVSKSGTGEVNKLTKTLAQCVEAVGDLVMIFGVVKYGTAMSSDNAKELTTGITALVTGAILANISLILGI